MKEINHNFKKKFGQNFLNDTNLLKAIVEDAKVTANSNVLEIGPGAGALSEAILNKCGKLVSVEIDRELEPLLTERFKNKNNFKLIFGDIMKFPNEVVSGWFDGEFQIVANLPYNITSPIIFKFLEGEFNLKSMTIMVQKEVAERLTSSPGKTNYGAITANINAIADVKITRIVRREMFTPRPNVDSAIVHIEINRNKYNIISLDAYKKVVAAAFFSRRKTFLNNFSAYFNIDKQKATEILNLVRINPALRGEVIEIEKLIELANLIKTTKN